MANTSILANTNHIPKIDLSMSDDALVTFGAPVGPGALSFRDAGYMPVNAVTIGGSSLHLGGGLGGLFISYNATGVQHLSADGKPTTADYTSLNYQIIGYTGHATFGHAADGTPTESGASNLTVLGQGDLIKGQLGFGADGGITGNVNTSLRIGGTAVGKVDFSVKHAAGDIGPAPNGFTLDGGTLHATFVPLNVG